MKTRRRLTLPSLLIWIGTLAGVLTVGLPPMPAGGAETPNTPSLIHINQLGYLAGHSKIAMVSSPLGLPFSVLNADTSVPVLEGMLELAEPADAASGSDVWIADFSILHATGKYILQVEGIGQSPPFPVDTRLNPSLLRQTVRSYYLQRCGCALPKKFADAWQHPECHAADAAIFSSSAVVQAATGGWHDGGDYGKYTVSGVYAAGLLLLLHDHFPAALPDGSLAIPESGNSIPDLLDEVRWELEWLLRMQGDEGGFYHKLTSLEPVKPVPPAKDTESRFLFPPSTAATGGACALLAKASRVYAVYDADFAGRCLHGAMAAWDYLESHPPGAGFQNPPDVRTQAFSDADDSEERFWAAVELSLATKHQIYLQAVKTLADQRVPLLSASGYWGNMMPLAVAAILDDASNAFGPELRQEALTDLLSLAGALLEKIQADGYRLSLQEGEFTWGSNGALLNNAIILCLADRFQPSADYRQGALDQLQYILGRNPLSICYVTGFGSHPPLRLSHPATMAGNNASPIPGLLAGGPNQFLNDGELAKSFSPTTAPATVYLDSEDSFSSNQASIAWNAALAYVAAFVSSL
ncbi:MAG: glycoside hydrolase family 9 protein [bacterium]